MFIRILCILVLISGFLCASTTKTNQPVSSESIEIAKQLCKIMRFQEVFTTETKVTLSNLRNLTPEVSDKLFDKFIDKIDAQVIENELAKVMIKHYTIDEMKQLIDFYKTPVGRKSIDVGTKMFVDLQTSVSLLFTDWAAETIDEL
jgi:hypothetical protein